jgi:hypothetical protein
LIQEVSKVFKDGKNDKEYKKIENLLKDLEIFKRDKEKGELNDISEYFALNFTGTDI